MGNYEINQDEGYVRINLSDGSHEYIVSADLFGKQAHKVTRLFETAYKRGQSDLRRDLRRLLNT
jgi:hypothetical protein